MNRACFLLIFAVLSYSRKSMRPFLNPKMPRAHFKTDVLPYDGLPRRLPRPSFPEDFQIRRPWKAIVQGFETYSSH